MIALELGFLADACRATSVNGAGPEWPPHPQRLYGALVQAWGDGGCAQDEAAALRWVEALPPPTIQAEARNSDRMTETPDHFVPVNDLASLPDQRSRQQRTFAWYRPDDPVVRYIWPADPAGHRPALDRLASRVAAVGHSASLVRCAWRSDIPAAPAHWYPDHSGDEVLRVTSEGELDRLQTAWQQGRRADTRRSWARYRPPQDQSPRVVSSVFGGPSHWVLFEGEGDVTPDILALAHLTKALRDAFQGQLKSTSPALTGHEEDGSPARGAHLAFLGLPFVGHRYADGGLKGMAVVLPRAISRQDQEEVYRALATAMHAEKGLRLYSREVNSWQLITPEDSNLTALDPRTWCRPARRWASATPVILDRHLKTDDVAEQADLIAAACVAIGLPEPIAIEIHKHSALAGAESCYPARGDRRRSDWSFPVGRSFANRARRHVVLEFEQLVAGPVIVGAGRFFGFGLCRPFPFPGERQ